MNLVKKLLCSWFNYCIAGYTDDCDPVIERIDEIDRRVDRLERSYWKPRDLYDIG